VAAPKACKPAVLSGLVLAASSAFWAVRAETPPPCNAADPHQVRLQVSVSDMRSTAGSIVITIYPNDAPHFLDGAYKVARLTLPVTLPVTHACFVVSAPAYYAVALFHDENNSGHFETTLLGLPAKGYGFSNNPALYLGPPDLGRVRFEAHVGDNPVSVQMKY
jgi:uncharacterized protein (DUF2141 family)